MNHARVWLSTASRLAFRLDLGRWLETTLPVWAGTSVVAASALLILRNRGLDGAPWFWGVAAGYAVTGLLVYVVHTRPRRTSREQALVWLEHRLHLHSRLTAAAAGVGPWPEPRPEALELLGWRPRRILPALVFSPALVLAAELVPVTPDAATVLPPTAPPLAWSEMERWLEELDETEIVDEQAIETWQERIDSLKSQPEEAWYSHSSLEPATV